MNRRVSVVVCCYLLTWLGPASVRGQLTAGPAPVVVPQATEVVNVWRPDQHLYVKGDLGVGRAQLDELEQWLDENGKNWTVVLIDDTVGERYRGTDGRYYDGMDAVEQALGRGLSNLTNFGTQREPRTGESNGAIFALSLGDRSFSYFASDAQDRRGLGESQWRGRLDRPAYEAMANGGRIVDAAKNTVQSIDQALDRAITGEEQARISVERERERTLERIKLLVERAGCDGESDRPARYVCRPARHGQGAAGPSATGPLAAGTGWHRGSVERQRPAATAPARGHLDG